MRPRDWHWREREVAERMVPARGVATVAALLGRRPGEVIGAVRCVRSLTSGEAAAAAALFQALDASAAAHALGCSPEEVVAAAEVYGGTWDKPGRAWSHWSASEDATLRRMATSGYSAREVAARLRRTRGMVLGRAWRLGIAWTGGDA